MFFIQGEPEESEKTIQGAKNEGPMRHPREAATYFQCLAMGIDTDRLGPDGTRAVV
jgi:hypothetical protein